MKPKIKLPGFYIYLLKNEQNFNVTKNKLYLESILQLKTRTTSKSVHALNYRPLARWQTKVDAKLNLY